MWCCDVGTTYVCNNNILIIDEWCIHSMYVMMCVRMCECVNILECKWWWWYDDHPIKYEWGIIFMIDELKVSN